ncbi:MAG: protein-export protein SecB [Pelagibacteraceae bacterium TMED246]|nr:MAG: protein-export protein SecB [Pelagibacteraceae bacterium TMED246]|tara:strand:- start:26891 stop:27313 length:423 start_codon:yes stop_codon:yes gene_type:complete
MTEKFKILAQFIKDASVETPDVETYLFVKDNLTKYHLNIDITSKPLKNKMIEVDTVLRFKDNEVNERKSFFEITYTSIVKVDEGIDSKKDLEKIILCDVQTKIYPNLEKAFLNLIKDSGFSEIKFEKKIDFVKLYEERSV